MPAYMPAALMVVAAAREICDYDLAFVGMRLPLLSFQLAHATHAPHATSIFEIGAVRDTPASEMIYTAATGWDLRVAASLHETLPPTDEELRLLRQFDPQGFWTRA